MSSAGISRVRRTRAGRARSRGGAHEVRDRQQPVLPVAAEAVDEQHGGAVAARVEHVDRRGPSTAVGGSARPVDVQPAWRRRRRRRSSSAPGRRRPLRRSLGQLLYASSPRATYRINARAHRHRHRLHAAPLLGPVRATPPRRRFGVDAPLRGAGHVGHRRAAARAGAAVRARRPTARSSARRRAVSRARSRPSAAGTRPATSSTSPRTARAGAHDATARWLERIGLPYDELYCSCDKVARCARSASTC